MVGRIYGGRFAGIQVVRLNGCMDFGEDGVDKYKKEKLCSSKIVSSTYAT